MKAIVKCSPRGGTVTHPAYYNIYKRGSLSRESVLDLVNAAASPTRDNTDVDGIIHEGEEVGIRV